MMTSKEGYIVDLIALADGDYEYSFLMDKAYFTSVDKSDIRGGRLMAECVLHIKPHNINVDLRAKGEVQLVCDRCLDIVLLPVDESETLEVRVGSETDEDEGVITVPHTAQKLDLAWLIYEMIVISLPLVVRHQAGECNPLMEELLLSHLSLSADEPEDDNDN